MHQKFPTNNAKP